VNKKNANAVIGFIIALAVAAVLFGTYQASKSSPPTVVRITDKPAGLAFEVRVANSLEIDGTLDRVSVLDKDGKRVDFVQQESAPGDWGRWTKYYLSVREYAKLQLE